MVLSAAYRYKDSIIQIYKGKENMPICNRHCGLPPGGRLEDIKVFRVSKVSKVSKVFKAPKVPKVSETPKVSKVAADEASLGPKKVNGGDTSRQAPIRDY